jgi:hypothetical protein
MSNTANRVNIGTKGSPTNGVGDLLKALETMGREKSSALKLFIKELRGFINKTSNKLTRIEKETL